jgi:hypothetical protein
MSDDYDFMPWAAEYAKALGVTEAQLRATVERECMKPSAPPGRKVGLEAFIENAMPQRRIRKAMDA